MQTIPKLSAVLKDAHRYLAHVHPSHAAETYEEHYDRVNAYFVQICAQNGLDPVIDRLILDFVSASFPASDPLRSGNYIKELFVKTIVFHDYGKVNHNFQADPKRMNNSFFKMDNKNPLKHHHAKAGAYMYIVQHFEANIKNPPVDQRELGVLLIAILMFSYSIVRHHAGHLICPDGKGISFAEEEFPYLKAYLSKYGITAHENITDKLLLPHLLGQKFFDQVYKDARVHFGFPFWALLRLNFSLLTASDYLATGQYSYDLHLETALDWGILTPERRAKLVDAARNNPDKPYNGAAYALLEQVENGTAVLQHPVLPTGSNLNALRTEMAVEVLQTLKKHTSNRLFYLEAPTGGGKTNLSMLAVAEILKNNPELNKVFYVFPFTTLITQTHKAIKETLLLTDAEIALLHGKSGFQAKNNPLGEDEEDALYGEQRKDFLQNLFALYPFSLVTHVRFFEMIKSNGKDDIYLMHRLANSVVVLDELQSYPPKHWDKMLYMLDQYGVFFNIRFVLMSATLPRLSNIRAVQRASGQKLPEIVDLLPNPKRYFQNVNFRGRVQFRFDLMEQYNEITADELADEVLARSQTRAAENDGRVFTIIEFIFKKSATEFKAVMESKEGFFDEIFVLSGTILESRRREIIYHLKRNRKAQDLKILLITTQVVEAGVDIDMDLGFKNVSLIDSDEQLAGRVNRNVDKSDCEVYLFRKDDPTVLYRNDLRYQVTREFDADFHREILETKDFGKLYDKVFDKIEAKNKSEIIENFETDYLDFLKKIQFSKVSEKFRLIEQQTLSVFVPLALPLFITDEKGATEAFFNEFELKFLQKTAVWSENENTVDGRKVWSLYREKLSNPHEDFIAKKIEQKILQGILAKFTFSLFCSEQNQARLMANSHAKLNLDNYYYLHRWDIDQVYHIESGLNEAKLDDPII